MFCENSTALELVYLFGFERFVVLSYFYDLQE